MISRGIGRGTADERRIFKGQRHRGDHHRVAAADCAELRRRRHRRAAGDRQHRPVVVERGAAVEAIRALDQGARQLVEANATAVDPANNNKLVHLSGAMTTPASARDTAFGVGGDDLLRLQRTVEMFQWTEQKSTRTQKNLGGSETTETTYSYRKEWYEHPGDSGHL